MTRGGAQDPRSVDEVVDLGVIGAPTPLDGDEGDDGVRGPIVSRRTLLASAGLLTAGAVGVGVWRRPSSRPWTSPTNAPPIEIVKLPRPLPGVTAGWELFGLGDDVLLRIRPASGRVTRTLVPPVGEGQVSLVPVRHRVLIRPVGERPGYVVPDDSRPIQMPAGLAGVGSILPGPDLDHVWTQLSRGRTTQMALVPLDGGPAAVVVPVPEFATTGPMIDGAGGVLFEGVGGLYHISPTGRLQISNAILVAVGPGALLTLERDAEGRWRTLMRPDGGVARRLPVSIGPQLPHGVLAPDGRRVVLYLLHEPVSVSLAVVDLATGVPDADRVRDLAFPVGAGQGTIVWFPDGSRVVTVDQLGRAAVVDAVTGRRTPLGPDLPAVRQLAVRSGA